MTGTRTVWPGTISRPVRGIVEITSAAVKNCGPPTQLAVMIWVFELKDVSPWTLLIGQYDTYLHGGHTRFLMGAALVAGNERLGRTNVGTGSVACWTAAQAIDVARVRGSELRLREKTHQVQL